MDILKSINTGILFVILIILTLSCRGETDSPKPGGEGGRLIWKTEVGITGLFRGVEFFISDDRIYLVSLGETLAEWDRFIEDPPKDKLEGVYCLDAGTGEIIWHKDIGDDPFSDVVLDGDTLYLYSPNALLCLNADNGDSIWGYPLSGYTYTEGPAVADSAIFVSDNDKVLAVSPDTHELLWDFTVPVRARSLLYHDGSLLVGAEGKWEETPSYLFRLDAHTGAEIWRYEASDSYELTDPPVIVVGRLYLHSSEGRVHCVDYESGAGIWVQNFAEWDAEDEANYVNPMVGTPEVSGDRLYIGRSMKPGYVYCVDTDDGSIIWKRRRYPDNPDAEVTTAVTASDGKLYYGWQGWKVETEGGHRSAEFLSCMSAEDGAPIWDYELENSVATTPQVYNDRVYFGSSGNYFYCLRAD